MIINNYSKYKEMITEMIQSNDSCINIKMVHIVDETT